MDLLNNNVIDFGILREPFNRDLYANMKINILPDCEDDYFVAAGKPELFRNSNDSTITIRELVSYPIILHRRFEDLFLSICSKSDADTPNIMCRNDNIMSSIEWAIGGIGVSLMPFTSSLLIEPGKLAVKKIVEPSFYSNLYLIWNSKTKLLPASLEFIQLIKSYSNILNAEVR